jgi:RimJ/RimL family protein N-acetyltransferase
MKLETDRLLLRPVKPADAPKLFAYRSDAETNQYQGWIPKTMEEVVRFIANTAEQPNEPESWFQLALINKSSEELVGDLGLHFFDSEHRQVEVGCTLSKQHHRKGYAREALAAVLTHLFTTWEKHRVITSIDPANTASIRLVEYLGFRKEAHFEQSLYLNGRWVDDAIYAMLASEWRKGAE